MTILSNDIKIRASKVMADVPEGGGGPSGATIAWGQSNTLFDDVDTVSRTIGNVSIRQAFLHVDTDNTDRLLGAYAMVAKLPADPNVSVTLASCAPFARRSQISEAIANYLIRGVPWNGLLMGNHVQGQASLQLMGRPGVALKPTVGRTLAIVSGEGTPQEATEWVRVIKVESEVRTFSDDKGDYPVQVVSCELASGLTRGLTGTDPNRYFAARTNPAAAVVRDTTVADAANYYGAAATSAIAALGAYKAKVTSVYGQLVPSSATQVPALDQTPASRRTVTLATSPRLVEVAATPHARRILIGQENRGLSYVFTLSPLPEPGTLTLTWVGLGNRQTAQDDGSGTFTGRAAGVVNYLTGSAAVTLPSLPDAGSALVLQWGERVAYTNRSSQGAQVRPPEFSFMLEGAAEDGSGDEQVVRSSLSLAYTSGGTVYTITDDGSGNLVGDGAGVIDYPSRSVIVRPTYMPDAGAQFDIDYELDAVVTDIITPSAPDGGGFISFALSQQPAAGTLAVQWAVASLVSTTSGASDSTTAASKSAGVTYTIKSVPEYYEPAATSGMGSVNWPRSAY
ncbi:hypothetical protein [Comamonas sp. NLF-1-9]|uniref:hypothetical protein n=1 Tax=Comamonas sp. NLF-1-9 TaxID=2853163 RepID=UPI001C451000|nr:hypothetical protein [Comamonas sp. NLF-1-9]QXL84091.1 hypothetical protein KUD94_12755 [Comamonas sp. NLF-1-9]